MDIDYKFWYITKDDDGNITECGVRFFEGGVVTEDVTDSHGVTEEKTFYKRSKRLQKLDLPAQVSVQFKVDAGGNEAAIYTHADFGAISDEDELRLFLNKEIEKDPTRTPNNDQSYVDLSTLKSKPIR